MYMLTLDITFVKSLYNTQMLKAQLPVPWFLALSVQNVCNELKQQGNQTICEKFDLACPEIL